MPIPWNKPMTTACRMPTFPLPFFWRTAIRSQIIRKRAVIRKDVPRNQPLSKTAKPLTAGKAFLAAKYTPSVGREAITRSRSVLLRTGWRIISSHSFLKTISTGTSVPTWSRMSSIFIAGVSVWIPKKIRASSKCPLEEMGRNSPRPCINPRRALCRTDSRTYLQHDDLCILSYPFRFGKIDRSSVS